MYRPTAQPWALPWHPRSRRWNTSPILVTPSTLSRLLPWLDSERKGRCCALSSTFSWFLMRDGIFVFPPPTSNSKPTLTSLCAPIQLSNTFYALLSSNVPGWFKCGVSGSTCLHTLCQWALRMGLRITIIIRSQANDLLNFWPLHPVDTGITAVSLARFTVELSLCQNLHRARNSETWHW